jgi:hypothetical protein
MRSPTNALLSRWMNFLGNKRVPPDAQGNGRRGPGVGGLTMSAVGLEAVGFSGRFSGAGGNGSAVL